MIAEMQNQIFKDLELAAVDDWYYDIALPDGRGEALVLSASLNLNGPSCTNSLWTEYTQHRFEFLHGMQKLPSWKPTARHTEDPLATEEVVGSSTCFEIKKQTSKEFGSA